MRRPLGQTLLLITGILACPCLSIPIAAVLLSGTIAGAWWGSHVGLVTGLATGYFLTAVGMSLWLSLRHATFHPKEPER